jgi:hypothetical protein
MYTDIELKKILGEVEREFNTHLVKKEEESKTSLAKSEDKPFPPKGEKKPEEKEEDKEEKKPEGEKEPEGEEEPKEAEGEQHVPAAEGEAHAEGEKQPEGQPNDQAAAGDEGHGYDEEDMQHMQKMYMSMSKSELKAHHDACRMALDSQGMQKCGDMGMAKSENLTVIDVKIPVLEAETALLKSELSAEKAKTADLQKKVELAGQFMAQLAAKKSAPKGKAIENLEVIQKSDEIKVPKTFTKAEVSSILNEKVKDSSLTKSDRDAINAYYLGSKDIKLVSHLLPQA